MSGIRKGLGFADRPEHAKIEASEAFERELDAPFGEQRGTAEIDKLLDEFEHECFMLRVEASETRAKDEVVREAYERIREASAQAIAATLGGGKLTAEQVMAIAGRHQPDYCSDTHVCFDWQAIADELNAAIGGGECEVIQSDNGLKCSRCGKELPYDPYADYEGNFCATCGTRLRYGRR